MALCRCNEEHANPQGREGNDYVIGVEPIGYPNTSSICGRTNCENPGLIWLTKEEYLHYQQNINNRIFSYANVTTKVKVIWNQNTK